jgi:hypothetical protein
LKVIKAGNLTMQSSGDAEFNSPKAPLDYI